VEPPDPLQHNLLYLAAAYLCAGFNALKCPSSYVAIYRIRQIKQNERIGSHSVLRETHMAILGERDMETEDPYEKGAL
jgi:hypothetical protein